MNQTAEITADKTAKAAEYAALCPIELAPGVCLPIETVTARGGIFGISGSGKTYTGSVLAEEMLAAGAHVVILDPLGVWWGLRAVKEGDAGNTGSETGAPSIYILGGKRADLPLDPLAGAAIADLVIEEKLSVILDMSGFEDDEQKAVFAASFARQLLSKNELPIHVFCDEADLFVPQMADKGAEYVCRKAFDNLVRRGRVQGIGVTLISQRPAVVAKNALTQITTLTVHQLTGQQDQAAVGAWFRDHGTAEQQKVVSASLASLAPGEAWVWSPSDNVLQRVKVRARKSFDSSATPKFGAAPVTAKRLAAPDLTALAARLAASVEAAQENDPEILQKRLADSARKIAELEKALGEKQKATAPASLTPVGSYKAERVEVPVLPQKDLETLQSAIDKLAAALDKHKAAAASVASVAAVPVPTISLPPAPPAPTARRVPSGTRTSAKRPESTPTSPEVKNLINDVIRAESNAGRIGGGIVTKPQKAILNALAEFEALGVPQPARANLAVWADQSPTSSGYSNNLSALRTGGFVDYAPGSRVFLTAKGRNAAVKAPVSLSGLTPEQTTKKLLARWSAKLSGPQSRILGALVGCYPKAAEKASLARATEQSPTSSGYANNVSKLRSLGLVDYPKAGYVVATDLLFLK